MTNRAELRPMVRDRLADPASGGMWADADVNAALALALATLSAQLPKPSTWAASVAAAATSIPAPADAVAIHTVQDAAGAPLPQIGGPPDPRQANYLALAWYAQGDTIALSRAVTAIEAGLFKIAGLSRRNALLDDVTAVDLDDELAQALTARAAAALLRRRLGDDVRRNKPTTHNDAQLARALEREADDLVDARRRIGRTT